MDQEVSSPVVHTYTWLCSRVWSVIGFERRAGLFHQLVVAVCVWGYPRVAGCGEVSGAPGWGSSVVAHTSPARMCGAGASPAGRGGTAPGDDNTVTTRQARPAPAEKSATLSLCHLVTYFWPVYLRSRSSHVVVWSEFKRWGPTERPVFSSSRSVDASFRGFLDREWLELLMSTGDAVLCIMDQI